MTRTELGTTLTKIRKSKNISKYRLNKDSSISRSTIDSIEKGMANYTIDVLIRYCEAVGVDVELR